MKFENYRNYEGRLYDLQNSLADDGWGTSGSSDSPENGFYILNEDEEIIAKVYIEYLGSDGCDKIKILKLEEYWIRERVGLKRDPDPDPDPDYVYTLVITDYFEKKLINSWVGTQRIFLQTNDKIHAKFEMGSSIDDPRYYKEVLDCIGIKKINYIIKDKEQLLI